MKLLKHFACIILFIPLALAERRALPEGQPCNISAQALETASKIRGLRAKRPVPCISQNKKQVEEYIRRRVKEELSTEQVATYERTYKMIGAIPEDYNYLEGLIGIYTSQLGGYYDPEQKYYAMAEWMPDVVQLPIAIHELTHALQDQHFELDKITDSKSAPTDVLMARMALIEGDATAVMFDYSRMLTGEPKLKDETDVSSMMLQSLGGALLSPGLASAPPIIQASLFFPYISGFRFAHQQMRTGDYKRINSIFSKLPQSSEEILHPEKYGSGRKEYLEIPELLAAAKLEIRESDIRLKDKFGEFAIASWLDTLIDTQTATKAADGWGGDAILLIKSGDADRLMWITNWDNREDAEQFVEALRKFNDTRYQAPPTSSGSLRKWKNTAVEYVTTVEDQRQDDPNAAMRTNLVVIDITK